MLPRKRILVAQFVLLLIWHISSQADELLPDLDYQPGQGIKINGTGWNLGGYTSASYHNDQNNPGYLGADDISLFLRWEGEGKFRFFSEWDLEKALEYEDDRGITSKDAYLALERFYGDYLYSDKLNFRAGKFLTPIGRWNIIHAPPLVWTTSRPMITERMFPTNATGAMAYGTLPLLNKEIDYSIYTSLGRDLRPDPKLDPFQEAFGFHLNVPFEEYGEVGLSYVNFEQKGEIGERKNLLGLDYFWTQNRYELTAEMAYRFSDEGHQLDEKGLFIQGVAPLSERWYAIGRYEAFDRDGVQPTVNLWLAGVACRLSPAVILKAEYSHAFDNQIRTPEGFFTSFAILF